MIRVAVGLVLVVALAVAGYLWLASGEATRPNILLITIDTLRADHLGVYGYERDTSPNLDAFAATAAVFDNAFTHAGLSSPSHATMMTGLYSPAHGVIDNGIRLQPEQLTLAEILQAVGYETAAFTSYVLLGDEFGFEQGFDVIENNTVHTHQLGHRHPECDASKQQPPLDAVFRRAGGWLGRPHPKPFFQWIHLQHPHSSYEPPEPFNRKFAEPPESAWDLRCWDTVEDHHLGRIDLTPRELDFVVALYDGEIAFVDSRLKRIFSQLESSGLDENTIVVITADHGEMLFDDPEGRIIGHGREREDPVLRVPLMIRAPGIADDGRRIRLMVGLIDLAPTILDLAGVPPPAHYGGRSLVPALRGKQDEIRPYNFSISFHGTDTINLSIRSLSHKLMCVRRVEQKECEFFDLERDPLEHHDVIGDPAHARQVEEMRSELDRWFDRMMVLFARRKIEPRGEEALEVLRRGGYLRDAMKVPE